MRARLLLGLAEPREDEPANEASKEDGVDSQASNEAETDEAGEQTGQAGEGSAPIDQTGAGGDSGEERAAPQAGVTYQRDIRALLERSCTSCHSEGGIGPMPLDDFASVSEFGLLVVLAVSTRIMSPWPASDDCRDLRDVRRLSDRDVYGPGVSVWGTAAVDREREALFVGTGNGFATPVSQLRAGRGGGFSIAQGRVLIGSGFTFLRRMTSPSPVRSKYSRCLETA